MEDFIVETKNEDSDEIYEEVKDSEVFRRDSASDIVKGTRDIQKV